MTSEKALLVVTLELGKRGCVCMVCVLMDYKQTVCNDTNVGCNLGEVTIGILENHVRLKKGKRKKNRGSM